MTTISSLIERLLPWITPSQTPMAMLTQLQEQKEVYSFLAPIHQSLKIEYGSLSELYRILRAPLVFLREWDTLYDPALKLARSFREHLRLSMVHPYPLVPEFLTPTVIAFDAITKEHRTKERLNMDENAYVQVWHCTVAEKFLFLVSLCWPMGSVYEFEARITQASNIRAYEKAVAASDELTNEQQIASLNGALQGESLLKLALDDEQKRIAKSVKVVNLHPLAQRFLSMFIRNGSANAFVPRGWKWVMDHCEDKPFVYRIFDPFVNFCSFMAPHWDVLLKHKQETFTSPSLAAATPTSAASSAVPAFGSYSALLRSTSSSQPPSLSVATAATEEIKLDADLISRHSVRFHEDGSLHAFVFLAWMAWFMAHCFGVYDEKEKLALLRRAMAVFKWRFLLEDARSALDAPMVSNGPVLRYLRGESDTLPSTLEQSCANATSSMSANVTNESSSAVSVFQDKVMVHRSCATASSNVHHKWAECMNEIQNKLAFVKHECTGPLFGKPSMTQTMRFLEIFRRYHNCTEIAAEVSPERNISSALKWFPALELRSLIDKNNAALLQNPKYAILPLECISIPYINELLQGKEERDGILTQQINRALIRVQDQNNGGNACVFLVRGVHAEVVSRALGEDFVSLDVVDSAQGQWSTLVVASSAELHRALAMKWARPGSLRHHSADLMATQEYRLRSAVHSLSLLRIYTIKPLVSAAADAKSGKEEEENKDFPDTGVPWPIYEEDMCCTDLLKYVNSARASRTRLDSSVQALEDVWDQMHWLILEKRFRVPHNNPDFNQYTLLRFTVSRLIRHLYHHRRTSLVASEPYRAVLQGTLWALFMMPFNEVDVLISRKDGPVIFKAIEQKECVLSLPCPDGFKPLSNLYFEDKPYDKKVWRVLEPIDRVALLLYMVDTVEGRRGSFTSGKDGPLETFARWIGVSLPCNANVFATCIGMGMVDPVSSSSAGAVLAKGAKTLNQVTFAKDAPIYPPHTLLQSKASKKILFPFIVFVLGLYGLDLYSKSSTDISAKSIAPALLGLLCEGRLGSPIPGSAPMSIFTEYQNDRYRMPLCAQVATGLQAHGGGTFANTDLLQSMYRECVTGGDVHKHLPLSLVKTVFTLSRDLNTHPYKHAKAKTNTRRHRSSHRRKRSSTRSRRQKKTRHYRTDAEEDEDDMHIDEEEDEQEEKKLPEVEMYRPDSPNVMEQARAQMHSENGSESPTYLPVD